MSDGFAIRFDDARAFAARMAQAPQIVGDELTRSVDRLTLQGERYTKVETPVRTGHLRRSIAMSPATFAGGAATGSWGTATPYARWIEEGRGPVVASPGKAALHPEGQQHADLPQAGGAGTRALHVQEGTREGPAARWARDA